MWTFRVKLRSIKDVGSYHRAVRKVSICAQFERCLLHLSSTHIRRLPLTTRSASGEMANQLTLDRGVHVAAAFVQPPARFLYIHSLTFTSLSFVGFVGAAMYCNWRQWQVPADALDAVCRTRMYTVVEPSEQEEGDGQEGNGLTKQHAE